MPDATPGDRALDLLRRLVEDGAWYGSAIELHNVNGEDAEEEAARILRDAGIEFTDWKRRDEEVKSK